MEIDTRFPTKLDTVFDAPEPLRSALVETFPSGEPVRLLVHAPAFSTGDEQLPATVLAVTNSGWLVASETEDGGATLEKSDLGEILFLELKSILLLGQLRISFAAVEASHSVTINFERVEDEFYHEAIDLMLAGIDPARAAIAEKDRNEASMFAAWPMKFRNEAQRYWPRGQRLVAAIQWPAIFGEFQRQLAPAGALLITERELVVISDGKKSSAELPPEAPSAEEPKERPPDQESPPTPEPPQEVTPTQTPLVSVIDKPGIDPGNLPGDVYEFAEIITFVPRVRLTDFQVSHQEGFGVLTLQLQASQGGEKLEIVFPSDDKEAVSKGMEQMLLSRGSANQTINEKGKHG
jgi:hypothetical protein